MSDIVERLRQVARELPLTSGNHAWLKPEDTTVWEAAAEIEKLREENENLRKTIRDGIKLIDLDAVKSFRKTLKWALGEKE
jgi:DNA-binding ferritin-like protein